MLSHIRAPHLGVPLHYHTTCKALDPAICNLPSLPLVSTDTACCCGMVTNSSPGWQAGSHSSYWRSFQPSLRCCRAKLRSDIHFEVRPSLMRPRLHLPKLISAGRGFHCSCTFSSISTDIVVKRGIRTVSEARVTSCRLSQSARRHRRSWAAGPADAFRLATQTACAHASLA